MSKFISKQSVASWYALTALLATFLVGQVILWFFPDGTSIGASLLFILMNCIPLITAAVFSLVLSEVNSLGEFFKRSFFKKKVPCPGFQLSSFQSSTMEPHSFSGMLALLGTPSWPSYYIFPGPFYMGGWKKQVGVGFYKNIFPLASTL